MVRSGLRQKSIENLELWLLFQDLQVCRETFQRHIRWLVWLSQLLHEKIPSERLLRVDWFWKQNIFQQILRSVCHTDDPGSDGVHSSSRGAIEKGWGRKGAHKKLKQQWEEEVKETKGQVTLVRVGVAEIAG